MKLLLIILIVVFLASAFFISNPKKSKKDLKKKNEEPRSLNAKELICNSHQAYDFLRKNGIQASPKKIKFFSIVIDNQHQPLWFAKDVTGKYYTFGAKGENFKQHNEEPLWEDFCPLTTIILYDKYYYIDNDTTIISAT